MASIPLDQFLSFVRTLEGEIIETRAGRSRFTVRVLKHGLEFTPESTRTPRGHTFAYTQRVLDRFAETHSWSTADYQFTVNASYQLTLIDRFLAKNREGSKVTYWRMQLHPDDSSGAIRRTVESLSAGYIGLDFAADVGDLLTIRQAALPTNQRHYWAFAHEMKINDRVLLFAHHFPFALVRIGGEYNYIRSAVPELGVWFRHFRRVDDVRYYGDFVTNAKAWEPITMTATITPLRSSNAESSELIDRWLQT